MILRKPAKRGPKAKRRIARKTRPRSHRVSASATIAREAAALWSRIVRGRAGGRCEQRLFGVGSRCHSSATDAAHARGKKAHPETRYLPEAGVALCRQHHEAIGSGPRMRELYITLRGEEAWTMLLWARPPKMDAVQLECLRGMAEVYR